VVTVSVVVTGLAFGVTIAEEKSQPAIAGSPLQERVIALVKEPWGVTVRVNIPGCPAVTLALGGFEARVKSPIWKLWLTGVAAM
jgi:hypothetical protein